MIRPILKANDKKLRLISKPVPKVDKKVLSLIEDLRDTLAMQEDPEGVGLAAPQIGKNVQVFVMKIGNSVKSVINPVVIDLKNKKESNSGKKKARKKSKIMEGCLSLPHFYGPLKRNPKITIKYLDEQGKEITEVFTDFPAQIVQHEIDHLNGVFFTDRLLEQRAPLYEYHNGEWEQVEL